MRSILRTGALLVALLALISTTIRADGHDGKTQKSNPVHQYQVDPPHTQIGFKVRHLGIANVTGAFEQHATKIELDPTDLTTLSVSTVIETASVNTGVEKRDNHLRSDDFFDAESYPEIKFVSTKVTDLESDGTFKLHGDLTIKDVTKPIVLEAEFRGPLVAMGKERVAFSAVGKINRFDYGLRWNKVIEAGGLVVSETVKLIIEVEALREVVENSTS